MSHRLPETTTTRASFGARLGILVMVAAGFALTMVVFYPGYMTTDAGYVYRFMQEWSFGDWQSQQPALVSKSKR